MQKASKRELSEWRSWNRHLVPIHYIDSAGRVHRFNTMYGMTQWMRSARLPRSVIKSVRRTD